MNFFSEIFAYLESGGFVMWPLLISIFVLWYALGYRYNLLKRGNKRSVRELIRKYSRGYKVKPKGLVDNAVVEAVEIADDCTNPKLLRRVLDDAFFEYDQGLKKYKVLVKVIVVTAPLAGLLGTVIGMIETFDSLASMSLFSQTGGIAGGISQALFTTQFGLVVAVPGLVVGRLLDRKAQNIEIEFAQIKDILVSEREKRAKKKEAK